MFLSHNLTLLAEAHGQVGQAEAGLAVLAEALEVIQTDGERWYEAETCRVQGELTCQTGVQNRAAESEMCFQKALEVARHQQAKSWELRAATSLARLWQGQGKTSEAQELLAPVYDWFTEGFDTADLKDAKELLDGLR